MTPKSFIYLAAAAAASVLLAIVSFGANNQWGTGERTGEKLLPGFSANEVAEMEVRQGDNAVVLEKKQGGNWFMKSRDGYPVDMAKVRLLMRALARAELIEGKTGKAERYAALELEDPAGKTAKSRLVKLTGAKGSTIAEVVIGKQRAEAYGSGKEGGTYVRKVGEPRTWLANVELSASTAVKDWVKTTFLTLEAEKINRIGIEIPGEQALKIERPAPPPAKDTKDAKAARKDAKEAAKDATKDAKDATKDAKETKEIAETKAPPPAKLAFVAFPPEGKKLKDAGAAEALARAVSSIDLEDVRKLTGPPSGEGVSTVRIELKDGPTATLRLRKDGDAHWLSITVADGEGEAAKKAAEEITSHTKDWEFRVPALKAEAILKKRSDLLEAPKDAS
jgi:hypothetical protein